MLNFHHTNYTYRDRWWCRVPKNPSCTYRNDPTETCARARPLKKTGQRRKLVHLSKFDEQPGLRKVIKNSFVMG